MVEEKLKELNIYMKQTTLIIQRITQCMDRKAINKLGKCEYECQMNSNINKTGQAPHEKQTYE